jgi:hypothetical protein
MSPGARRFIEKRRLFKANSTQKIPPVTHILLEKKWFYRGVHQAHIARSLQDSNYFFAVHGNAGPLLRPR